MNNCLSGYLSVQICVRMSVCLCGARVCVCVCLSGSIIFAVSASETCVDPPRFESFVIFF